MLLGPRIWAGQGRIIEPVSSKVNTSNIAVPTPADAMPKGRELSHAQQRQCRGRGNVRPSATRAKLPEGRTNGAESQIADNRHRHRARRAGPRSSSRSSPPKGCTDKGTGLGPLHGHRNHQAETGGPTFSAYSEIGQGTTFRILCHAPHRPPRPKSRTEARLTPGRG